MIDRREQPEHRIPALGSDVHVWTVALEAVADGTDTLSPAELASMGLLASGTGRRRYGASHAALRRILSAYAGPQPAMLEFAETPEGKPFLRDGPAFSLSHSGALALVAVAEAGQVGVDVERIAARADAMAIARDLFSAGEVARLGALSGQARQLMFHRLWTCREAVLKCAGTGLAGSGLELGFGAGDGIFVRALPADAAGAIALHELRPADGYAAAVAWSGPLGGLRHFDFGQVFANNAKM